MGGDQRIEGANGTAPPLELMAHLAVRKSRGFIEWRDMELQQEPQSYDSLTRLKRKDT